MKKFLFFLLFTAFIFSLSAYDVDREELEKNKKDVEFINYTGTHEKIDTRKEISLIGSFLGNEIKGKQNVSLSGKYRILHLVDPSEPEKMGADIFILEKNAGVDHIRNLRLILSAYLKAAYGYSDSDSSLLAEYVTYYNAVFRGNISYFESKYNNMVLVNITAEDAGIDVHYKNWPGKTRMIIPLKSGGTGEIPVLSSKELSDKEVIEDLRKNTDKGIPPRKEMAELREKELDRELEKTAEKEEKIEAEKENIAVEKVKVDEEIKELEEKKTAGDISEENYEEEKAELEGKKEKIVKKEDDLNVKIEKVKEESAAIEKEKDAVSEEREVIAADTNKLLDSESAAEETTSLTGGMRLDDTFFIRIIEDDTGKYGELVLLDNKTGQIGEKTSVKKTGIRGFIEEADSYLLLTGSDNGNDFYLMKINNSNLELKMKSDAAVYRDSVISESSGFIYAVIIDNGNYRIGKFSKDLILESSSKNNALKDTFIFHNAENNHVFFQQRNGDISEFNSEDLSSAFLK